MISVSLIAVSMTLQFAPGMDNQAPPLENHTAFGTIYTRAPGSAIPPPNVARNPSHQFPRYSSPLLPGSGVGSMGSPMARRMTTRGNQPGFNAAAMARAKANAAGAAKIRARAAARGR